ncbi:MAG: ABC transporter substrate-binding protein, partial [Actinobacteria bacterium]|nr:ABC transporter substrate-binding protein [Actinomycetota bacterium]
VAAARKLMVAAGYGGGFSVKLDVPNRVLWQDAVQIIKSNLAQLKIDVTINMVTPDTAISDYINRKDWGMMWFGNNAATPILQLSNWFFPGGVWANNANIPDSLLVESSKLLTDAGSSKDAATIKDKLTQVEKIAWDLSTFIPVGTRFYLSGSNMAPGLVQALMPGQLEFVIGTNPALATS